MIYVCEKCPAVFVSDETPENCPECKSTAFRRATDNEVINYIGGLFVTPFENSEKQADEN